MAGDLARNSGSGSSSSGVKSVCLVQGEPLVVGGPPGVVDQSEPSYPGLWTNDSPPTRSRDILGMVY